MVKPDADLDEVDDVENVMWDDKHQRINASIVTIGINEERTDVVW